MAADVYTGRRRFEDTTSINYKFSVKTFMQQSRKHTPPRWLRRRLKQRKARPSRARRRETPIPIPTPTPSPAVQSSPLLSVHTTCIVAFLCNPVQIMEEIVITYRVSIMPHRAIQTTNYDVFSISSVFSDR